MKTPAQNFLSVVSGKNVLFLENDSGLYDDLANIEIFLKLNKVKYTVLCDIGDIQFEDITKAIELADVIIFQTQWVMNISMEIRDYMFTLKAKKIVIEAYINDPTWYYKPRSIHDVYILMPNSTLFMGQYEDDPTIYWKFYKLRPKKPFWTYKNNFDN